MKKYSILLTVLLLGLFGCEKEIPFDAEVVQSKLVLNSLFSSDSVWAVHVSRSLSIIDEGELVAVPDADVRITDEAGNPVATLFFQGDGLYVADTAMPSPNRQYRIEARAPGYEPVFASDAIPGAVQIVSLDTIRRINPDDTQEMEVELTFVDPSGASNYYMLEVDLSFEYIFGQDTMRFGYNAPLVSSDPNIEIESGIDNIYPYLLLRDRNFDGQTYTLKFTITGLLQAGEIPYRVRMNLVSSSEAFFNYRRSFQTYVGTSGNPFAQPVQVYSNVEGGYGIFAGGTRTIWEFDF